MSIAQASNLLEATVHCTPAGPVRAPRSALPVSTPLGLSNEPGWLDGHGWISAPQCRQLLTTAELCKVCVNDSGQALDSAERPEPLPQAVRGALLGMVTAPFVITPRTSRAEPQHDPTPGHKRFVLLRDRYCDGPSSTQAPAGPADLDQDRLWPHGPTTAWNLTARPARPRALKHYGWTPVRAADSTCRSAPLARPLRCPATPTPHPIRPPRPLPDRDQLHELDAGLTHEPPTRTTRHRSERASL